MHFHLQFGLQKEELGLLWRDLHARSTGTVFLSWEWMRAWLDGLDVMPWVLVGEAEGALVLLGLLVPRRRVNGLGAIQVNGFHLHTTGREEADVIAIEYNGFLVDRGWAGRAEVDAVRWLLGRRVNGRRFDEIDIKAIETGQGASYCPEGMIARCLMVKPSWRVDLEGVRHAGGDYLATLSSNTRQQIRRSMRLYEQFGALDAAWAPDVPTALCWLDELATLHQRQWRAKGKPGGWGFPFFAAFQRRLVEATLPLGMAEIVRVSAGPRVVGYVYNLISGDHVMAFVTGFAMEQDSRLKPGLVSHGLCIQHHADQGRRTYDFLAGDYRYKASLGAAGPRFTHLQVQRPTAMTRFELGLRSIRDRVRSVTGKGAGPERQAGTTIRPRAVPVR